MFQKYKEFSKKGAASLFIVIFSILLFTIIALSFMRIVLRGARTSSENDLSQSAYDSATAGVEDAKRALSKYISDCSVCIAGGSCSNHCNNLEVAFQGGDCDVLQKALGQTAGDDESGLNPGSGETHDGADQAYTCVKVAFNTLDYLGSLDTVGDDVIIPLRPISSNVSKVRISWFSKDDISSASNVDLLRVSDMGLLPTSSNWPGNRPPIIVAQYFRISDLNNYDIDAGSNQATWTLQLFPTRDAPSALIRNFTLDDDRAGVGTEAPIVAVRCDQNFDSKYACSADIELGATISAQNNNHFLRLSKRYFSKASFKVEMLTSAPVDPIVKFAGVQPSVDSNGRANDFFRRVQARLDAEFTSNLPFPLGAVEIAKGSFCKGLTVTDDLEGPVCNE